jgi:hypothetical protein
MHSLWQALSHGYRAAQRKRYSILLLTQKRKIFGQTERVEECGIS